MEPYPEDLGQQFTEMLVKQTENVSLLLSLLQVQSSAFTVPVYSFYFCY